jgi:hypothetical protein
MKSHRPGIFVLLVLGVMLRGASLAAPAPAASYESLLVQGTAAYGAQEWSRCAEILIEAAEAATSERQAARAFFGAAACTTAKGDKDAAFALLDKAAAKGYRDTERAVSNPILEPLQQDPRWQAFFAGAQARNAEHAGNVNAELAKLYQEDQADREGTLQDTQWREVEKRDAERRQRVLEITTQGGAKVADDYYHAAMVFQHGIKPEDHDRANEWCLKALELDPDHPMARWLAAASKDRALMWRGKPQLYGTQFKMVDDKWILWEVDPSITDEERARWDVPPLAVARKKAEELNAGTLQPH